jgi:hypothetical protein
LYVKGSVSEFCWVASGHFLSRKERSRVPEAARLQRLNNL